MKSPHGLLKDVTKSALDDISEELEIRRLDVEGKRKVMATGDVRALQLCDGLLAAIGYLKGQSAYSAKAIGIPGLTVEVRLSGRSSSRPLCEKSDMHEISPGDYLAIARDEPEEWAVEAPAQDLFKTVSLSFSKDFLKALNDAGLDRFTDRLFASGERLQGRAPMSLLALAEQFLTLDSTQPLAALRLRTTALSVLLEVCEIEAGPGRLRQSGIEDLTAHAKRIIQRSAQANLKVSDVARQCRVSATVLKEAFRAIEGISVGAYIRNRRMVMAQRMLLQGVPIAAVAQTLHYSAPESFGRAYRRFFGHAPSAARHCNEAKLSD